MKLLLIFLPILILRKIESKGIGKAWRVSQYPKPEYTSWDHSSWPRLDSSAFEVRSVSGVGRLSPSENLRDFEVHPKPTKMDFHEPITPLRSHESLKNVNILELDEVPPLHYENPAPIQISGISNQESADKSTQVLKKKLMTRLLAVGSQHQPIPLRVDDSKKLPRVRREANNETRMEKISAVTNVREARLASPESWSSQPISVEFRHRTNLDQILQQHDEEEEPSMIFRNYHAPRTDFITSHHRRHYGDGRESRGISMIRNHDDYDLPWYKNSLRDRDYDYPYYRYGYYQYPQRYRMERDYYMRVPTTDPSYYYDRYRDEDLDLYGRNRPTPKPKRIIYYATLPEVVRKPVDMRNYPRPYDGLERAPITRDGSYKRVPGNVDPGRYRYRHLYDGYDSYSKRSSFFDKPYSTYQDEEEARRKATTKENSRNNDDFESGQDRKLANQISNRDENKLPWPVQIGTEVSVKDDERIPGRKIFGEVSGYERLQSVQIQKAPDTTGSSELQDDN